VVKNDDGEIEHIGGSYIKAKEEKDDLLSSIVPAANKK